MTVPIERHSGNRVSAGRVRENVDVAGLRRDAERKRSCDTRVERRELLHEAAAHKRLFPVGRFAVRPRFGRADLSFLRSMSHRA